MFPYRLENPIRLSDISVRGLDGHVPVSPL